MARSESTADNGSPAQQDLVQPSLLDRLTDGHPQPDEGRMFSRQRLSEVVLRDLSWLLNATQLASSVDLQPYPHVAQSTLNYGVRALTGRNRDGISADQLRRGILLSLRRFEPRLIASSIKVTCLSEANEYDVLRLKIEADLWAQPMPLRMVMHTEVDRELGNIRVVETPAERR